MLIDVSLMSIFSTGRTLSLSPLMIVLFFVLSLSLLRALARCLSLSLFVWKRFCVLSPIHLPHLLALQS